MTPLSSPVRSFDASAPSPWDRSPSAGGTQRQLAQSHGSTAGQAQLVLVTPPGDGFPTTYTFDADGLRRSIQTTNVNHDPPTLAVTLLWDGTDYLGEVT